MGNTSLPPARGRLDGELAEARAAYPGLNMAAESAQDLGSQRAAHDKTMELLKAHPDLKAILGNSPASVLGAAQAVTEMGLIGKVGVFGTSFPSEAGDFLRSGAVISIQFSVPADAGYAAARAAYALLKGGKVEDGVDLGRSGYDRVTVKRNSYGVPVAYGMAWVDVDRNALAKWVGPDGSLRP